MLLCYQFDHPAVNLLKDHYTLLVIFQFKNQLAKGFIKLGSFRIHRTIYCI